MRFLTTLVLLCTAVITAESALAAMTIDFGTQFLKIGIVKPGTPMDIALNTESRRKTPNVVLIHDGHRTFGDAAIGLQVRHPHLVFGNINDLFAKSISHPSFEHFKQRNTLYEIVEQPKNESAINFNIGGEVYSVETLAAMILANAKKFTEEHAQIAQIKDVVITVPVYFTPVERLAVERAAQMAGFNVLQLINDGTAAALSHGIFRRKEITEKPQRLLVYDMGAAKTTATLVEFKLVKEKYEKQPKMTVLGVGYDRTLGGIEMTNRLKDHLIEKFENTYKPKTPVKSNRRAMAKFSKEAERLKQVLSANAEHFAQIESAHEDIDARLKISRQEFEELIGDLETRIAEPLEQALRMAQIPIEDIDQVVLMGAGTRVPKVKEVIQKTIGSKEIGKFLNTDEAIAMGALFQAAHLSAGFKVKPFNIEEKVLFPVEVHFVSKVKEGETEVLKNVHKSLFTSNSIYPSSVKAISLTSYTEDFSISLKYGSVDALTKKQVNEIGDLLNDLVEVDVSGLTEALANRSSEETEFKGVKVSLQLDASGIVRIRKAEATIETKSLVGTITDTISGLFGGSPAEEGEPTNDENAAAGSATEEEATPKEAQKDEKVEEEASSNSTTNSTTSGNTTETAGDKKKKEQPSVVRLRIVTKYPAAYVPNKYDVNEGKKLLEKYAEVERLAAARAAAENELESFNFEASLYLEEDLFVQHASGEEKEKLKTETERIRTWLEDEANKDTPTQEFIDNLLILKNIVRSVKKRAETEKELPEKLKTLETLLETSLTLAKMGDNEDTEKALFDKKDSDAFKKKLEKLRTWIEENKKELEKRKKFDDFNISVRDVETKTKNLNKEVDKFMKKMKKVTTLDDLAKEAPKEAKIDENLFENNETEKEGKDETTTEKAEKTEL